MAEYSPSSLGERLRTEMERQGFGDDITRFREAVAKVSSNTLGSSYANVWGYVKGGGAVVEPRRKLIEAFAKVLRVPPDYLLYGGPRTADESPLTLPSNETQAARQQLRKAVYEAIAKEVGPLIPVGVDVPIIEMMLSAVSGAARSMQIAGGGAGGDDPRYYTEAASSLGRALAAPLRELALDPATWPQQVKAQYILNGLASVMVPLDIKYGLAVREWSKAREVSSKRKARKKRKRAA